MRFKDRCVVVMGGSRGIGRAIALGFAAEGAEVAICARGAEALEDARRDIAAHGHAAFAAPCDLADAGQIDRFIPEAAGALGGIDVLVNNASGFGMTDDEAGWAASFNIDIMAIVRASHAALPFLEADEGGSIVNIASISGLRASNRSAPYAAAKAAVINYTATQARMFARQRIRVNAISPGAIEFPGGVWDRRKHDSPKLYETTLASIPFGRFGTAEEVAEVALFLASPAARWVTGQNIAVDGGQLLGGYA
ncbi:SDR family oxidoreductase [Acidiphilium sp. AL]|uniref:SDR family oxidoreductase n=1 Tax=Acidiphilium iwatense TaxID=768198 RepID=A0ABS9DXR4_9PROT|nr:MULTISPECIES: SDR family NAD(P)-dependent oxidoreductase [Acidiphilium]MCF3946227.1 SDR family oxidoreductase [Acidiphilium iwatense]MCU4158799.1 SDR family oxidoreductase [Acidiphilium sp. AL]